MVCNHSLRSTVSCKSPQEIQASNQMYCVNLVPGTEMTSCNNYFDDKTESSLSFQTWINNQFMLFNLNPTNPFTPHQKPERFFSILRLIAVENRNCRSPRYLLLQVETPKNQRTSEVELHEWGTKREDWPVCPKWWSFPNTEKSRDPYRHY